MAFEEMAGAFVAPNRWWKEAGEIRSEKISAYWFVSHDTQK
jgi:hypothetical protein